MDKYIYKITNNINGKVYIGQTNNLKRRIQEHKHDKRKNKPIHSAIVKYGWENFSVDILYYGENYNKEEKKWIKYYDSQNKDKGYNIVEGGQDSSGEDNPSAKLTQKQVDIILDLLSNTDKTINQISKETGVSVRNIHHINNGESWYNPKYTYPIRLVNRLSDEKVKEIIKLLQNGYSYDEISNIIKVKSYIICNINLGKSYKQKDLKYPIYDLKQKEIEYVNQVIDLLKNTDLSIEDIANIVNRSVSNIDRINRGITLRQDDVKYPIRKNKNNK